MHRSNQVCWGYLAETLNRWQRLRQGLLSRAELTELLVGVNFEFQHRDVADGVVVTTPCIVPEEGAGMLSTFLRLLRLVNNMSVCLEGIRVSHRNFMNNL